MNSEFCMQCGAKVEFSLKAPNFCPSCGNRFNETAEASVETSPVTDELESEPSSIPKISKLEYSIGDVGGRITFGDLAQQAQSSSEPYQKMTPRPAPSPVEGEDILKTTMADCASAREPNDVSG